MPVKVKETSRSEGRGVTWTWSEKQYDLSEKVFFFPQMCTRSGPPITQPWAHTERGLSPLLEMPLGSGAGMGHGAIRTAAGLSWALPLPKEAPAWPVVCVLSGLEDTLDGICFNLCLVQEYHVQQGFPNLQNIRPFGRLFK